MTEDATPKLTAGRAAPRRTRLQAGAEPDVERIPELRDLVHDHLGPRRLLHDLLPGVEQRRPGRDLVGLADHLGLHPDHRVLHVRARLGDADRGRDLLLVGQARQPRLGLVHGLVQPARPDRDPRVGRLLRRAVPLQHSRLLQRRRPRGELRRGARRPGLARADRDVRDLRDHPADPHRDQHPRQPPRRGLQQHLGVVAHRRRDGDHRPADLRPEPPPERETSCSPTRINNSGFSWRRHERA